MKSIILVAVAIATLTAGLPMPDPQANLVPGIFISADTFKRLQDQANANRQSQPEVRSPEPVQSGQIITLSQPSSQPVLTNQQAVSNQASTNGVQSQPILTNQPSSNQPIYLVQQQPAQSVVVPQKQPANVVVSTSNASGQPSYSNGNVYAVVPLNNPNQNTNTNSGNTYLIPVPSGSSNPIILNASS